LKFFIKWFIILGVIGGAYLTRNQILDLIKGINSLKEATVLLSIILFLFFVLYRLALGPGSLHRFAERVISSLFADGVRLVLKGVVHIVVPGYRGTVTYISFLFSKFLK
jgi:hypothetical protein